MFGTIIGLLDFVCSGMFFVNFLTESREPGRHELAFRALLLGILYFCVGLQLLGQ